MGRFKSKARLWVGFMLRNIEKYKFYRIYGMYPSLHQFEASSLIHLRCFFSSLSEFI